MLNIHSQVLSDIDMAFFQVSILFLQTLLFYRPRWLHGQRPGGALTISVLFLIIATLMLAQVWPKKRSFERTDSFYLAGTEQSGNSQGEEHAKSNSSPDDIMSSTSTTRSVFSLTSNSGTCLLAYLYFRGLI